MKALFSSIIALIMLSSLFIGVSAEAYNGTDPLYAQFSTTDNMLHDMFTNDDSIGYWKYSHTVDDNSDLQWLIDSSSRFLDVYPEKDDYIKLLSSLMMMQEVSLADQISHSSKYDSLDLDNNLVVDAVAMVSDYIGILDDSIYSQVMGLLSGAEDALIDSVEKLQAYEACVKSYSESYILLTAIINNTDNPTLKAAAQEMLYNNDLIFAKRIELLGDLSAEGAAFNAEFCVEQLFLPSITENDYLMTPDNKVFVEFYGELFTSMLTAINTGELTFDIILWSGNFWFGTTQVFTDYNYMAMLAEVADALTAEINKTDINYQTDSKDEINSSIKYKAKLYKYLLSTHNAGEHKMKELLEDDAGILDELNNARNDVIDKETQSASEWYDEQLDYFIKYDEKINDILEKMEEDEPIKVILNDIPKDTTSESTSPEITTPESTSPEITTPESTSPEITTPESTSPETSKPETDKLAPTDPKEPEVDLGSYFMVGNDPNNLYQSEDTPLFVDKIYYIASNNDIRSMNYDGTGDRLEYDGRRPIKNLNYSDGFIYFVTQTNDYPYRYCIMEFDTFNREADILYSLDKSDSYMEITDLFVCNHDVFFSVMYSKYSNTLTSQKVVYIYNQRVQHPIALVVYSNSNGFETPDDIAFNTDGTYLYVHAFDRVIPSYLAEKYDISTDANQVNRINLSDVQFETFRAADDPYLDHYDVVFKSSAWIKKDYVFVANGYLYVNSNGVSFYKYSDVNWDDKLWENAQSLPYSVGDIEDFIYNGHHYVMENDLMSLVGSVSANTSKLYISKNDKSDPVLHSTHDYFYEETSFGYDSNSNCFYFADYQNGKLLVFDSNGNTSELPITE